MDLYLQFGFGMKNLSIELARKWGKLITILSPRDMSPEQMISWCRDFKKNNISCLFDPQCYCPQSELKNLSKYDYWDKHLKTNMGSIYTYEEDIIQKINKYNDIANTIAFICPSILRQYSEKWENEWIAENTKFINAAKKHVKNKPIWATITLPSTLLLQKEDTIEGLINVITSWNVEGYYIIAETPNKQYLVDNPLWLSNIFNICAALKLVNKTVVFGYGNHQLLPLSIAKVDAIASGTWLNVRSFTNRFITEEETKRKSTWVYYPEALSEYKLSFIDLAFSAGVLKDMKLGNEFINEYSEAIFNTNTLPSATGLTETTAFKFYLCSLREQILQLSKDSYRDTVIANEVIINTAERTIEQLEKRGIYAQSRSFKDIVDVNRAAMQILHKNRGFLLEMSWNKL